MELFADASYCNLDINSTEGYIVLLRGRDDTSCPLSWNSNRIHKVVLNTLSAEAIALVEGVQEVIYIREMLEEVCGLKKKMIKVIVKTDNMSVVQAIRGTKAVAEKTIHQHIKVFQQALDKKEIHEVKLVPRKNS